MPSTSLPGRRTRARAVVHIARRSTPRSNSSDSFHGPEAVCLSGPSFVKEYREHYTAHAVPIVNHPATVFHIPLSIPKRQ